MDRSTKKPKSAKKPASEFPYDLSQDLKNSHIFLTSIVENIPHMIFVKDAKELRFVRFNKAGEELLGYSREDLIGKNDYDFFPKKEADFFTKKDREVLESGELYDIAKEPIHTKHLGRRILHTKKIPVLDPDGTPMYLLGISEDITERIEAERNIQLYADVVKNIQIAFLIWRLEKKGDPKSFRLIATNPIASQITGLDMSQLVGKTMAECFPQFMETIYPKVYMQVIETGEKKDIGEMRYGDEKVKEADWSLKAFPLPDQCVGVAYENVTERKKMDREILSAINREQNRIGQDLHDGLGQDLTAISFLSKALEKKMEEKKDSNVKRVREILKLVNQSINRTRGLARGLHPVELEAGGIKSAINELAVNIENIFNIKCDFVADKKIPSHSFDEANHLFRITQEAVHNAIKHGQAKVIKINLTANGPIIDLSIQDDGKGIPKSKLENSQGMGMQIMNYRAKILGGNLDIEAGNSKGTFLHCSFKPQKK